jgi:transposase
MAMLRLLASGVHDAERLADCARGHMRVKIPALILALDGRPDRHFRWMIAELLAKLDRLDEERARIDARIDELVVPYPELLRRLATIPGVDRTTALVLLAEFGEDMTRFPTPGHLAKWAGLCPGNAESAGKRFSGRTRKGDRYVRRALVQSAWAAARTHDCFLAALFRRVARRRGLKKAAVAVAHRILIIAWHILAEQGVEYYERGGDHFDRRNPERTARKLSRRLEAIGYKVTLVAPPKLRPSPPKAPPPKPSGTVVDPSECPKCARWRLPHCLHAKRKLQHQEPPPH